MYTPIWTQKPKTLNPIKDKDKIEGAYIQRKYDGVATQIVINESCIRAYTGGVALKSQTFTELTDKIPQVLSTFYDLDFAGIIQGECVATHLETDELNFKYTNGTLKRHDSYKHQLHEGLLQFVAYDMPSSDKKYKDRYAKLQQLFNNIDPEFVSLAPILDINRGELWKQYFEQMVIEGHEGIVLSHPDNYYKHMPNSNGRNSMMFKIKVQNEREVKVLEKVEGESSGKFAGTLGALICTDGIKQFRVGSLAITDEERSYIWNNVEPPFIIEMKVMEETTDSYRHSVMTRLRLDKRIEDWNQE